MESKSFGKYTLIERIGAGGMAEVFKAEFRGPEGFSKVVALKLMVGAFSERDDNVRMFIDEAKLVAGLEHANIVRVYEFGKIDGRYYISMELVRGVDLATILSAGARTGRLLSVPEAIAVALEAGKGLAYAHGEISRGSPVVIHRDISPQNIMVSEAGEVKIADFGIAKLLSAPSVTKSGILKGKTAYVSPEQVNGVELDTRSDIFSLGIVFWEMLTGQRLFKGSNDYEVLQNLMQADIRPPGAIRSGVGGEIDGVVLRMLERDREKRYRSVSEIIDELSRILVRLDDRDRTQLIRCLYTDLVEPELGRSTKEFGVAPGSPVDSIPIDTGDVEDGIGESFAAATSPDRPSNIREAALDPEKKRENSKSAIRQEPKLKPSWILAIVFLFLVSVVYTVYKAISREGLPDRKDSETVSPGVSGAQASGVTSGNAARKEASPDSNSESGKAEIAKASASASFGDKDNSVVSGPPAAEDKKDAVDNTNKSTPSVSVPNGTSRQVDIAKAPKNGIKVRSGKSREKRHAVTATGKQPFGKITVEAVPPGAKVYLGEKYLGRAPLREFQVPVGRHLLKLEDASGHRRQKWINVRNDKTSSYVMLMGEGEVTKPMKIESP